MTHSLLKLLTFYICCILCISCSNAIDECRYFVIHRDIPQSSQLDETFLTEITKALGSPQDENLRLGVSIVISILNDKPDEQVAKLKKILHLSEKTNIPIYINIDGQNWVDGRPDLWNWWDSEAPGYNPENRNNVEWYDWSADAAVKICWRDWGRQLRVRPPLNIFAPKVVEAHREGFDRLLPILKDWVDALPEEKKHLFIGLHIGWEAGFNYNAYHYKGGNKLYEKYPNTEEFDPKRTTIDVLDPISNMEVLGYSAATTLGIKREGKLTLEDFESMTRRYLEMWCKHVASYGFTQEQIFTHLGGNYEPFERHYRYWPAINDYSTPGWSFYSVNPHTAGSLDSDMAKAGRNRWAATEWLWLDDKAENIYNNIQTTFSFRDCHMVVYYNWEGLSQNSEAQQAIRMLWENN